jgi:hypothetical protein
MDLSRSHLPLNDRCHRDGTIAPDGTKSLLGKIQFQESGRVPRKKGRLNEQAAQV